MDASVDAPLDTSSDAYTDTGSDAWIGCGSNCPKILVVRGLFLGDSDRSFMTSPTAWKQFGLDIDGKTTSNVSSDVCKRQPGAPSSIQTDGTGGIDNSFGANFVPLIQSAASLPTRSR